MAEPLVVNYWRTFGDGGHSQLFHQIDFAIEAEGRFALLPDNDFRASRAFYTLNQHKGTSYFNTRAANPKTIRQCDETRSVREARMKSAPVGCK